MIDSDFGEAAEKKNEDRDLACLPATIGIFVPWMYGHRMACVTPWIAASFLLSVAACATRSAWAQDTVSVSGDVSCGHCVVTLDTVAVIGGLDGPGFHVITHLSRVAVDSRGRIVVVAPQFPELSVFDSTGAFIRTVGRGGEGPGEYQFITHLAAGFGYIHVFDHLGRTLMDHDFSVVRVDRFPGTTTGGFVADANRVVFAADVPTQAMVGHTLHVLSSSGDMTSAGGHDRLYTSWTSERLSAVTGNAEIALVLHKYPNRITRWDLVSDPVVSKVFERATAEFDKHDQELWPQSYNRAAMLDANGLWVLWSAPDPEWTPQKLGPDYQPIAPPSTLTDSWLDLVDPTTGSTVARYHTDETLIGFANGSRYVILYRESDAGVPSITLLRPTMSRSRAPPD